MPATQLGEANLFLRSETLANAAWSNTRCSLVDASADVLCPTGEARASKWVEDNTAGATHFFLPNASPASVRDGTYLQSSFYVSSAIGTLASVRRVYIQWNDGLGTSFALFNPRTGLVDQQGSASRCRNEMVLVNANWYRCQSTTFNIPAGQEAATSQLLFELDGGANAAAITNVYNGNAASGVYIWGMSLGLGSMNGPIDYAVTAGVGKFSSARGLVR